MRLSPEYVDAIRWAAGKAFGQTGVVRLFGSRIDDHLRGGDIDLQFEVDSGRGSDRKSEMLSIACFQWSADQWSDAVRGRNALAHEYPLRPEKRAAQIDDAWNSNPVLSNAWAGLQRFIDQEGLLK